MMRTLASATTLAAVLALTGCSGDDTDDSATSATPVKPEEPTPSVPAADGPLIEGSVYTFNVPEGWDTPAQDIPGLDFDSMAADLSDGDGFSDNVNVIRAGGDTLTPDQAEETATRELETGGASDVAVEDRVVVDGEETAHLSATISMNGASTTVDQFYLAGQDGAFIATFSFSPSVSATQRAEVTDSVLASWTWTS
ncbi:hypothetical protein GHK92_03245 [Nocardioides sp. dk4132]|uniref:hypothetical protein n=1 Tax=unclassified Nocardioides TaxID=2615069 RepID=UPI001297F1FD|nr:MULTISPECIES: hypothetical protein [unclassified Nocardioides]MQW74877.1 hypothetical protein [Nocardioides sp. dk4132]QGA06761.1 hypothetical protein GFH29_04685 [Nocardioides sp. dk884]